MKELLSSKSSLRVESKQNDRALKEPNPTAVAEPSGPAAKRQKRTAAQYGTLMADSCTIEQKQAEMAATLEQQHKDIQALRQTIMW